MKIKTIAFLTALLLVVLAGCNNAPLNEDKPQPFSFSESVQSTPESEAPAGEESKEVETTPEAEKDVADREAVANEVPTKSRGEIIVEEAMGKPMQKEGNSHQNPSVAKTDKSPLSERDLETTGTHTDKGVAKAADKKPSVKEKLDRYKAAAKAEKEAERTVPEASKEKPKTPEANRQTVHRQPKKSKKSKER